MKRIIDEICKLLLDAISEFYENDSKARTFGTDTQLYHSEIHMLRCIEENPNLHISGIARHLKITRGAASQTAKRLERKQMVVKDASPDSNKKVVLRLTPKGKIASANHESAHEGYDDMIAEILSDASTNQLQFLLSFLRKFEEALNKMNV